jgi:hypothetical protein
MQYLVEDEKIDCLIPMKDVQPDYISHIVISRYEQLIVLESENKIRDAFDMANGKTNCNGRFFS